MSLINRSQDANNSAELLLFLSESAPATGNIGKLADRIVTLIADIDKKIIHLDYEQPHEKKDTYKKIQVFVYELKNVFTLFKDQLKNPALDALSQHLDYASTAFSNLEKSFKGATKLLNNAKFEMYRFETGFRSTYSQAPKEESSTLSQDEIVSSNSDSSTTSKSVRFVLPDTKKRCTKKRCIDTFYATNENLFQKFLHLRRDRENKSLVQEIRTIFNLLLEDFRTLQAQVTHKKVDELSQELGQIATQIQKLEAYDQKVHALFGTFSNHLIMYRSEIVSAFESI